MIINIKEIIIEINLCILFLKIKSDKKLYNNTKEKNIENNNKYLFGKISIFNKQNKIAKKEKTKQILIIKLINFIILSFMTIILSFIKFISYHYS